MSHRPDAPRLRSPEVPVTPVRCRAVKADGTRCEQVVPAEGDACLWHDDARTREAQAARARGAEGKAAAARAAKYRTVPDEAVPPLSDMDDAVAAAAWVFRMTGNGTLDPATSRELNRSITTFKDGIHKRDLLRRIRELEKQLKLVEQQRGRVRD